MKNQLLSEIEHKTNALENEKRKLLFPNIFSIEIVEEEHHKLINDIANLQLRLEKITEIEIQKDNLCNQLTEYIKLLEKEPQNPFSKSQGYIGKHHFYVKPLIDIKTILFNDIRGIFGANLYTTIDESDEVNDREKFLTFILNKRKQINEAKNMFELFNICRNYIDEIKMDFC